jgi:hypothetical protein
MMLLEHAAVVVVDVVEIQEGIVVPTSVVAEIEYYRGGRTIIVIILIIIAIAIAAAAGAHDPA